MDKQVIGYILVFWFPLLMIVAALFSKEGRMQLLEIGFMLLILASLVKGCCMVME